MSLKPRKRLGGDGVKGAFKAAKNRLKKKRREAIELKKKAQTKVHESRLTNALQAASRSSAGLSRRGVSLLKALREREQLAEKKEAPTGPDTPSPKREAGSKGLERQRIQIHLAKKDDNKPKGRTSTVGNKLARQAFLLHFQSAERKEWGLSYEEIRFRRRLIAMWFEFQNKMKTKGTLSPADAMVYEMVMRLMVEFYGEPAYQEEFTE